MPPPSLSQAAIGVLELLLEVSDERGLDGWQLMKALRRSGPAIYGVLDQLERAGWVHGEWELLEKQPSRPRRRFYRLTRIGAEAARAQSAPKPNRLAALQPRLGLEVGFGGLR